MYDVRSLSKAELMRSAAQCVENGQAYQKGEYVITEFATISVWNQGHNVFFLLFSCAQAFVSRGRYSYVNIVTVILVLLFKMLCKT
jgi:hypothetical protein